MGVLQLLTGFYEVAEKRGVPACGDVLFVPIPFVEEVPRILDVDRASPRDHTRVEFAVRQIGAHHFRPRDGKLPVALLKLESTEEALITRAKLRPAIVISRSCITDATKEYSAADQRHVGPLTKECFLVAPMYSTAEPNDPGMFMPALVARIRALNYPHLACLPKLGSNERTPGQVVRLDRLVATHLSRGCEHSGFKLHHEAFALILDQLLWHLTGEVPDAAFAEIVEVVR